MRINWIDDSKTEYRFNPRIRDEIHWPVRYKYRKPKKQKNGQIVKDRVFKMYDEGVLDFMTARMCQDEWDGKSLNDIDMSQLELEYDYDTDEP